MERKFKEALAHRRSYYALSNKSLVSNEEIEEIVKFAVKNIPSAFNSQSTRVVLLLGDQHTKLWNIVKDTLREIVSAEAFKSWKACKNHFRLIRIDSRYGHSTLRQCTNWRCGPCWKMPDSELHYSITIH